MSTTICGPNSASESAHRFRIVVDENMAEAEAFFRRFGHLHFRSGRMMSQADLVDADILLVRSVTRVTASLLANTAVKFVGSATIGTDHVDKPWLQEQGIRFAHAPGCNANAVVEYVLSALSRLHLGDKWQWGDGTIGIVGGGHVGGLLARVLLNFGMTVKVYDPFLSGNSVSTPLVSRQEILACDVISFHTPLTHEGHHPTHEMVSVDFFRRFKGTILINAGRGPVVNEDALLKWLDADKRRCAVLDVWPSEPMISSELMRKVFLGTPHIAGYSLGGRVQGTRLVYHALCEWLKCDAVEPDVEEQSSSTALTLQRLRDLTGSEIARLVIERYDIARDHEQLRALVLSSNDTERGFDALRKHYSARREFLAID